MAARCYAAATVVSSGARAPGRSSYLPVPAAAAATLPRSIWAWTCGGRSRWRAAIRAVLVVAVAGTIPRESGFYIRSEEEWKKRLTEEQYYVTRRKGTERAFTGEYWNTKIPGIYHCVCCDTPLFESSTKFDSGTGWPSYNKPIGENVKSKLDVSIIFMPRREVLCAACDAHLGQVFDCLNKP